MNSIENSNPLSGVVSATMPGNKIPGGKTASCLRKKIVHGTQRALDKDIVRHMARGWEVERYGKVARGAMSRLFTYVAYLRRLKLARP